MRKFMIKTGIGWSWHMRFYKESVQFYIWRRVI